MNHSDPYMAFCLICVVILFKKGDKVLLIRLVPKHIHVLLHCPAQPSLALVQPCVCFLHRQQYHIS